jgi:hypothetical protein
MSDNYRRFKSGDELYLLDDGNKCRLKKKINQLEYELLKIETAPNNLTKAITSFLR